MSDSLIAFLVAIAAVLLLAYMFGDRVRKIVVHNFFTIELDKSQQKVETIQRILERPDVPDQDRMNLLAGQIEEQLKVDQFQVLKAQFEADHGYRYATNIASFDGDLSPGRKAIMEAIGREIGPERIIAAAKGYNLQLLKDEMTRVARQVRAGGRLSAVNEGALTGIRGAGLISFTDEATDIGVAELLRAANRVAEK